MENGESEMENDEGCGLQAYTSHDPQNHYSFSAAFAISAVGSYCLRLFTSATGPFCASVAQRFHCGNVELRNKGVPVGIGLGDEQL